MSAQPDSVRLDQYSPAPTTDDGFAISRPDDRGHLQLGARLDLDYGYNPLVIESSLGSSGSEVQSLVEHQLVGHLNLSLGLFERLVIFAGLPVNIVNDGQAFGSVPGGDGAGLGDFFFGARVRLLGEASDLGALSLQLTATFPTASAANAAQRYTGEDGVGLLPVLLLEVRPIRMLRITGNVGARIRTAGAAQSLNLSVSHELTYGLGVTLDAVEDLLAFYLEVYGAQSFENFGAAGARESAPLEGILGARVNPIRDLSIGLAAGMGLLRGYGSPDFRGVFTIGWASHPAPAGPVGDEDGDGIDDNHDRCVHEPEDRDGFEDTDGCPDPDNDGDGLLDTADECPMEPETMNGHDDGDGCPDEIPDTDGDGLLDNVDQCSDSSEDRDGFQDEDGCPDSDNDNDGVLDDADRCRDTAGPIENRGCPDTDRDSDTLVDRLDNCPDEAGPPEFHGCPQRQLVRIETGQITILDRVFFSTDSDRILARSHNLLRNVAQVINQHPEIERVLVEGHTDSHGNREHNIELSQRRAESVVRFLVQAGVAANRLEARGHGPDRPRVENARTSREHAENRRVEFHVSDAERVEGSRGGQ